MIKNNIQTTTDLTISPAAPAMDIERHVSWTKMVSPDPEMGGGKVCKQLCIYIPSTWGIAILRYHFINTCLASNERLFYRRPYFVKGCIFNMQSHEWVAAALFQAGAVKSNRWSMQARAWVGCWSNRWIQHGVVWKQFANSLRYPFGHSCASTSFYQKQECMHTLVRAYYLGYLSSHWYQKI